LTSTPEPAAQDRGDDSDREPSHRKQSHRPQASRRNVVALIVAGFVAALAAGGLGAWITNRVMTDTAGPSAPTAEEMQAAGVKLCARYAAVNASMPNPSETPLQVLTGVNGLRWALADNPDAGPEIRGAITEVVRQYDALIAASGGVQPQGDDPPWPTYDPAAAQQAVERVVGVCRFNAPPP